MVFPFWSRQVSTEEASQSLTERQDNILTDEALGMDTAAGSLALVGARKAGNAEIVDGVGRLPYNGSNDRNANIVQLINAGAIIIGKTTLSVSA